MLSRKNMFPYENDKMQKQISFPIIRILTRDRRLECVRSARLKFARFVLQKKNALNQKLNDIELQTKWFVRVLLRIIII